MTSKWNGDKCCRIVGVERMGRTSAMRLKAKKELEKKEM